MVGGSRKGEGRWKGDEKVVERRWEGGGLHLQVRDEGNRSCLKLTQELRLHVVTVRSARAHIHTHIITQNMPRWLVTPFSLDSIVPI